MLFLNDFSLLRAARTLSSSVSSVKTRSTAYLKATLCVCEREKDGCSKHTQHSTHHITQDITQHKTSHNTRHHTTQLITHNSHITKHNPHHTIHYTNTHQAQHTHTHIPQRLQRQQHGLSLDQPEQRHAASLARHLHQQRHVRDMVILTQRRNPGRLVCNDHLCGLVLQLPAVDHRYCQWHDDWRPHRTVSAQHVLHVANHSSGGDAH